MFVICDCQLARWQKVALNFLLRPHSRISIWYVEQRRDATGAAVLREDDELGAGDDAGGNGGGTGGGDGEDDDGDDDGG